MDRLDGSDLGALPGITGCLARECGTTPAQCWSEALGVWRSQVDPQLAIANKSRPESSSSVSWPDASSLDFSGSFSSWVIAPAS